MNLLLGLIGGFCGGLLAHFIWTSGILAAIEVRAMRARAAGVKIWVAERAALKNEISRQHIRLTNLEKKVQGAGARIRK